MLHPHTPRCEFDTPRGRKFGYSLLCVTEYFEFVTFWLFSVADMNVIAYICRKSLILSYPKMRRMKKMKAMYALPVVAVSSGGFSACSQDDDLFEYDLENDGVATLTKRSMGRNGGDYE